MTSENELRQLPSRRACREITNQVLRQAADSGVGALNQEKQHFRRAVNFHSEVLNGGLSQYFTNSSGQEYRETLESLELIGAVRQREILQRCIDTLSPAVDLADRNLVGRHVFGNQSVANALKQLDKEYYASMASFYQPMVDFALAHKIAFEIE